MACGSLLSFSVLIVAIGYQTVTAVSGAGTYIRACVDTFVESAEGKTLLKDSELARALKYFEDIWETVDRHIVSLASQQEQLGSLARFFSSDGCAMILKMKPALVHKILETD